jgi:hypothetical protein
VYFVRPNTLLLCILLFCIFLLYRTDPQVEVQIRIFFKEAAIKSKMWTPAITLWFPKHRFKENFYLGFFIKEKYFASQVVFLVKSKHWMLAKIWFLCVCAFFSRIFVQKFFFCKSRLYTRPLFSHFVKIWIGWPANRSFEFLRGVNPVGDDCMDLQPDTHDCFSKISRAFFASRN